MAEYLTSADQNVALNSPIPFDVVSIPCNKGCVVPVVTGVLTLKGDTTNRFARYEVKAQGNVGIAENGTVTPIAVAITLNGVPIPESVAIITPAAAEDLWHINTSTNYSYPINPIGHVV